MKNRKRIVVAFLCVAMLLLAVGYAAFTDTLTIIGNVVADMEQAQTNYDAKIYFSDIQITEHGSGDETADTVSGVNTDDATFAIHSLATMGEKAVIKFTIKSESNVDVKVTMPATRLSGGSNNTNTNTNQFDITYTHNGAEIDVNKTDIILPAGGSIEIVATVTVIAPITAATGATFGLDLNATTVE